MAGLDDTRRKMASREAKTLVDVSGEVWEELSSDDPDLETVMFLLAEVQSRAGKAKSMLEGKMKVGGA